MHARVCYIRDLYTILYSYTVDTPKNNKEQSLSDKSDVYKSDVYIKIYVYDSLACYCPYTQSNIYITDQTNHYTPNFKPKHFLPPTKTNQHHPKTKKQFT